MNEPSLGVAVELTSVTFFQGGCWPRPHWDESAADTGIASGIVLELPSVYWLWSGWAHGQHRAVFLLPMGEGVVTYDDFKVYGSSNQLLQRSG